MRRSRQRTQVVHTSDTYLTVLNRIFSRAGLQLTTSAPSSRSTTVTPKFTVGPGDTGYEAAQRALQFLADRIRMRTLASALMTEPLASAASDYQFGEPPPFGFLLAHPLRSFELLAEPPRVAETRTFAGLSATPFYGESIDYANRGLSLGTLEEQRDWTSAAAQPRRRPRRRTCGSARSTRAQANSSRRRTAARSCSTK
jgi:hypothetical protein